jgi:16S rRNA (guanine527-N7)-methyltransferase
LSVTEARRPMSAKELQRMRLNGAATSLGLVFDDATAHQLLEYLSLLQRWNATYNLTAVRDLDRMLSQHLLDCLAVVAPLRRHLGDRHSRLLDVGSGAGLPGVVIAVLCPEIDVTCVDTVGKKAAFVRHVSASLKLRNLHSEHARVEKLKTAPFDVVTSRAFASLADFVKFTARLVAEETGVWLAMKAKETDVEIAALPSGIEVFHVEQIEVPELDAERRLIWMRPARSL